MSIATINPDSMPSVEKITVLCAECGNPVDIRVVDFPSAAELILTVAGCSECYSRSVPMGYTDPEF